MLDTVLNLLKIKFMCSSQVALEHMVMGTAPTPDTVSVHFFLSNLVVGENVIFENLVSNLPCELQNYIFLPVC